MSRRWTFLIGQVVCAEKEVPVRVYPRKPISRLSDLGQGSRDVALPIGRYKVSMTERTKRYIRRGEYREEYRYLLRALDRSNPLTRELIVVWEEELRAAAGFGEDETQQLPLRLTFPEINRLAKDIARDHLNLKESLPEDAVSELAGWLGEHIEDAIHTALERYDAGQLEN
jgi:hypothetical protein